MSIEVEGPDGAINEFPDGTPDAVIQKALRGVYGIPDKAPAQAAPAPGGPSLAGRLSDAASGALGTVESALGMGAKPVAPPSVQQSSDLDAMMRGGAPAPSEPPRPPETMGSRLLDLGRGALGVLDQGVRGAAEGAINVASLPADAMGAILNRDPDYMRLRAALTGRTDPVAPFSSVVKAGVNEANDRTSDLASALSQAVGGPQIDRAQREPANILERGANRIGQEIGGAAIPAGAGVAAAGALGREGVKELPALARLFAEPAAVDRGRFVSRELTQGAAAGTGAAAVNELNPAQEGSVGHAAGDLAGALAGAGSLGAVKAVGGKAVDVVKAVTGSPTFSNQIVKDEAVAKLAQEFGLEPTMVGKTNVADVSPIVDAINRGRRPGEVVPGYQETLADRTSNPGLAALEYSRETAGSAPLRQRTDANAKAVDDALQAAAPQGNPGAFRGALEDRRADVLGSAEADRVAAQARFDEANANLQAQMHGDARGSDIRNALETALQRARDVEEGAWHGVSAGSADIRPLADEFSRIRASMPVATRELMDLMDPTHLTAVPSRFLPPPAEAAKAGASAAARGPAPSALDGLAPEERATAERLFRDAPAPAAPAPAMSVADRIAQAADEVPKDPRAGLGKAVWDIRAKIPDVSDEDFANGLRELMRDKRGMVSSLSDTKSIKPTERGIDLGGGEQHLWVPGDEAGRGDFASWPNGRPQAPAPAPEAPAAGTAAPDAPAPAPEIGPVNVPIREAVAIRKALTDAQRVAGTAGEHDRARVIGQYVDAMDRYFAEHHPNVEAYDQARAVSRDLNDRFTRPQTDVAQSLNRNQGMYSIPNSEVPGRFVRPDNADQGGIEALVREAGNDPRAMTALQDQIRSDVSALRSPEAVDRYVQQHSRVFDRFPDLRTQVQDATAAGRDASAAARSEREVQGRLGTTATPGSSPVGKYLRFGDEATDTAISGVLSSPKPAEAMDELLNFAGNAPEAVEGARRTFWNFVEKRARSRGETTGSVVEGQQPWQPARLARLLEEPRNRAVAERLYRDDPEQLQRVHDIAETLRGVDLRVRGRARNASGTAQGVLSSTLSPESLQSRFYAYQRGQVGAAYLGTSILATIARKSIARAQGGAIERLVDEALANPDMAAKLLAENNPANRAVFDRATRSYLGDEASKVVNALGNDEPGAGANDIVSQALSRGGREAVDRVGQTVRGAFQGRF
jgi:predicted ester cyclase